MKHQTNPAKLLLLLAAIVLTWMSCQEPTATGVVTDCDLTKGINHIIPDSVAVQYQQRFLAADSVLHRIGPDTFLAKHFKIPNAETFDKNIICQMIHKPGVDSIRIFYGEDSTGVFHLVIKGVNKKGQTIKTVFGPDNKLTDSLGSALENGQICPPCMITNLNP